MNILLESKAFKVHCDDCGKMLIRTPSGRCCPAGHGKIHKPFPERWVSRLNRFDWANSLPVATRKGRKGWEITGVDGLHQIVNATEDEDRGGRSKRYVKTDSQARQGCVLARLDTADDNRITVRMLRLKD